MQKERKWDLTLDEEVLYRQKLLARARKGDPKAKDELMVTYNVRLYSEREREKLPTYHNPRAKAAAASARRAGALQGRQKSKSKRKPTPPPAKTTSIKTKKQITRTKR